MASTKATRKAKRESYGKGTSSRGDSDNGSIIVKNRKAHVSKDAITKGAVKKSDAKAKEALAKAGSKNGKPAAQNGRQLGRQLIRWNSCTDQILLLIMEYELKRHNIIIPFDAIAKRLASEKETTGACVQQHLAKLRKEMLARGSWVPPLPGKPNARQQSNVRGIVMVKNRNGEQETREISWTEDAFKYVELVDINLAKTPVKINKASDNEEDAPRSAHQLKTRKSALDLHHIEVDPAELQPDEEFDPSLTKKPKKVKRITRASAKSARNSKSMDSFSAESDADADTDFGSEDSTMQDGIREPVMMALYKSEEEDDRKQELDGMVVIPAPQHVLAEYPVGINEAHAKTRWIVVAETDEDGEEVIKFKNSGSGSIFDAKTGQNYYDAFANGPEYSVMDANTPQNYAEAFGHVEDYSIMDANTAENYEEFVADGFEEESDMISEVEQGNNNMASFGTVAPFGGMISSGYYVQQNAQHNNTNQMYQQINNSYVKQGHVMGMNTPASSLGQLPFGQTAYGHNTFGSNIAGPNPLGQSNFHPNARSQDLLTGGPVNRVGYGNLMIGQNGLDQNAPGGGNDNDLGHSNLMNNGFVMGQTMSSANDPFASSQYTFNNQSGGSQTAVGVDTVADSDDDDDFSNLVADMGVPINDLGANSGNGGSGMQGSYPQVYSGQGRYDPLATLFSHTLNSPMEYEGN